MGPMLSLSDSASVVRIEEVDPEQFQQSPLSGSGLGSGRGGGLGG